VLRVECDKCGRKGQYRVDHLIEQYGIDAKLFDWEPEADCPRKQAKNLNDICGAQWPDICQGWSKPSPAGLWRACGRVNCVKGAASPGSLRSPQSAKIPA